MRIRDGDSSDPGSEMEKSRIRDPGCLSRNTSERLKRLTAKDVDATVQGSILSVLRHNGFWAPADETVLNK